MESGTIVKLRCITDEEKEYAITLEEGEISELIRNTTEDREDAEIEIDIPRVKSWCLGKVVEFLKHYKEEKMKDIPTPLRGSSFAEVIDQEWYQKFVSEEHVDKDQLFQLLMVANFMGIKPLLDLTCLKVTFLLAGKGVEEIREILKLPAMTPEEEAQARIDHKWVFEDA